MKPIFAFCSVGVNGKYPELVEILRRSLDKHAPAGPSQPWNWDVRHHIWSGDGPNGRHNAADQRERPYVFKAQALEYARACGARYVMWLDSSLRAVASVEAAMRHVATHGYLLMANGHSVGEWCTDECLLLMAGDHMRDEAFTWPDCASGCFGVDLWSAKGAALYERFIYYSLHTPALRGAHWNSRASAALMAQRGYKPAHTGPVSADPRVLGHRHDQTVLSILAQQLELRLTEQPRVFTYDQSESALTDPPAGCCFAIRG